MQESRREIENENIARGTQAVLSAPGVVLLENNRSVNAGIKGVCRV